MKKFLFINVCILGLSTLLNGQIQYRVATVDDVTELCNLYDTFTHDDEQRLLVFPKQVRGVILEKTVGKERIFVATDQGNIVGFVKLFLIDDQKELAEIFSQELRLGQGDPLIDCSYHISQGHALDFGSPLVACDSFLVQDEYPLLCATNNSCIYIYYGGAYTCPSHRGQGINTDLIRIALGQLAADCKKIIEYNPTDAKYIALAYGQVEANTHQKGMIRIFADFVQKVTNICSDEYVQHIAYRSYKPVITFNKNTEELEVGPDVAENRGQGNLAVIKLRSV